MRVHSRPSYPEPPWEMHGSGVFCPYLVPVRTLELPAGMEPLQVGGMAMGMLAYLRYEPPSPLAYDEMIWMPCLVRHRAADGQLLRGWWVARMWVDSEASLEGGRAIWALPKRLARFERHGSGVKMHGDHGTELALTWRRVSPGLPLRSRMATLQVDGERVVRFRARVRAHTRLVHLQLPRFSSSDPSLRSLDRAHRLGGAATMLAPFDSTMMGPTVHPRGTSPRAHV